MHIKNRRWIPFSFMEATRFALLGGWIGWLRQRTYDAMVKGRVSA